MCLDATRLPPATMGILKRIRSGLALFSNRVLSLTGWASTSLHIPSKWANAGFIVVLGLGMTFIQVDEYALAVALWVASATVLFAKAIHWKGVEGRPNITRAARAGLAVAAIAFVPLSVIWTQAKRGDKPWTALMAGHKPRRPLQEARESTVRQAGREENLNAASPLPSSQEKRPQARTPRTANPGPTRPHTCEITATPSSEIVARLRVRSAAPPVGSVVSIKPYAQELFFDWVLTIRGNQAVRDVAVLFSGPTLANDSLRVTPTEIATVSPPIAKWMSGFDEPSRKPDYYLRSVRLSLQANDVIQMTMRHALMLPDKENRFAESEFDRSFEVKATGCTVLSERYKPHEHATRLFNQLGTLGAWKYFGPTDDPVPIIRNPNMPLPLLSSGEVEATFEVRCTDSPCTNLIIANREIRQER